MTPSVLDAAMLQLSSKYRLDHTYIADSLSGFTATTEAVAHELAHAIDLQETNPCFGDEWSSRITGSVVSNMTDTAANDHELRTLRIETSALRKLGLRIDSLWLFDSAAFRGGRKPSRQRMKRRLTASERRSVARFVDIVQQAAKEVAP